MKTTHTVAIAIVLLLIASLAFAQQNAVTYGAVAAEQTPTGIWVEGEEVTLMPAKQVQASTSKAVHKTAVKTTAAQQRAAGLKATAQENAASLKKGEPALKVNTTTTTTDVYDVSVKNKKGTTDYGVVEQTRTNAQGKKTTQGVIYSTYDPSKMARANAKGMEISLAAGETISYNKDNQSDRYGTNGFAADVTLLKNMNDYLSLGLDYAMLHPRGKTHGEGAEKRHYHGMYTHNISLAGKLTLNPWNTVEVYMPMGIGMTNARMKTVTNSLYENESKWGASFYAGLGAQYNVTCWMFAGLEYRYSYAFISDKDLTGFHKDRNLQFHTLMVRMGLRF